MLRVLPSGPKANRNKGKRHRRRERKYKVTTLGSWVSARLFSFPPLIVVPLSSHEVDGVRKEKERLTAA